MHLHRLESLLEPGTGRLLVLQLLEELVSIRLLLLQLQVVSLRSLELDTKLGGHLNLNF